MITFKNDTNTYPMALFRKYYQRAFLANQTSIEAICISSLDRDKDEVDARYVNLKIVDNEEFIFFTNYNSPKAKQFKSHDQIAAVIYWDSINIQVRIKAKIFQTSREFNDQYFLTRSQSKNALAISSNQSNLIESYEHVKEKYHETKNNINLDICPTYWGGYKFQPYEIEFWKGDKNRLNKRYLYKKNLSKWTQYTLEP